MEDKSLKSLLSPVVPDDNGVLDANMVPFMDNTVYNSSVALTEKIILYPEVSITSEQLSFRPATQNGVFYDLNNSWFEFTLSATYVLAALPTTAHYWNSEDWIGIAASTAGMNPVIAPAAFHSFLRFSDFTILMQQQVVSDSISANAFAWKEFAKICINEPRNNIHCYVTYGAGGVTPLYIGTPYVGGIWAERDYVFADGIVSPEFTMDPNGRDSWVSNPWLGSWILAMREYMSGHVVPGQTACVYTVRFKPNDGVWKQTNYFPAICPMQFLITNRSDANANFWYAASEVSLNNNLNIVVNETLISARLILRQVRPSEKGIALYNLLFQEAKFLRYTIQHAELTTSTFPTGTLNWNQSGFFPNKKPQIVIVHFVPTINTTPNTSTSTLNGKSLSVSPFENAVGYNRFPSDLSVEVKDIYVNYGGIQYPRQNQYSRELFGIPLVDIGAFYDIDEYKKQCKIMRDGQQDTDPAPFLPADFLSGQGIALFVFNLQDNGDSFQGRTQTDLISGPLSISATFQSATAHGITVFITALSNATLSMTQSGQVTKSYT